MRPEPVDPTQAVRCKAVSAATGKPCGSWAVKGADVCRMHGGAAPQVRAAAARRVEQAKVEAEIVRMGIPIDTTPHEAIIGQLHRCAGTVMWLRGEIAARDRFTETNTITGVTEPSVYARLLDTWETHLRQAAVAAARMGIEDRQVRLAEEQGRVVAELLRALVDRYVPEPDQGDARRFIAGQLRAIGAAA